MKTIVNPAHLFIAQSKDSIQAKDANILRNMEFASSAEVKLKTNTRKCPRFLTNTYARNVGGKKTEYLENIVLEGNYHDK